MEIMKVNYFYYEFLCYRKMGGNMIYTVTFNPAIDYIAKVNNLEKNLLYENSYVLVFRNFEAGTAKKDPDDCPGLYSTYFALCSSINFLIFFVGSCT